MIGFLSNLNYLGVVYQSCFYYVYFCLVNFDPFSCIDRTIYLVLCTFAVYFGYLVLLSTFGNAVSVSLAIITPFLERWFTFEIGIFLIYVQISVIFSVRSTSESCMCLICVVFVSILLTYCSLRFSVFFRVSL